MAFWGPLVRVIKGLYDSGKLFYLERRLDNELQAFNSLDGYLEGLDGLERLRAKDSLAIAEYLCALRNLIDDGKKDLVPRVWKEVLHRMRQNLEEVKRKLESQTANMLQVAIILQGIQQLAGEMETQSALNRKMVEDMSNTLSAKADKNEVKKITSDWEKTQNRLVESLQHLKDENYHLWAEIREIKNLGPTIEAALNQKASKQDLEALHKFIKDAQARVEGDLRQALGDLTTTQGMVTELSLGTERLKQDLHRLQDVVTKKANQVDVQQISVEIEGIEAQMRSQYQQFKEETESLEFRLEQAVDFITEVSNEISDMKSTISCIEESLTVLENSVAKHDKRLTLINRIIYGLGAGILLLLAAVAKGLGP